VVGVVLGQLKLEVQVLQVKAIKVALVLIAQVLLVALVGAVVELAL
jgi:hypothetical protein